jgi:hypothetical protein
MTISLNVHLLGDSVLFNAKKLHPQYVNVLRLCERARMTASYGTRALPTRVCVLLFGANLCEGNVTNSI